MKKGNYFVSKIKCRKMGLTTIKLSCRDLSGPIGEHVDCITIHGDKTEVLHRTVTILEALNATH